MPLAKRIVQASALHGHEKRRRRVLEAVNAGSVAVEPTTSPPVEATFESDIRRFVVQLLNLVTVAEDLFSELLVECNSVVLRSSRIKSRVSALEDAALGLDAREASIPEGDITRVLQNTDNHQCSYGYDVQLFRPASRPICIQQLHRSCDINPVHDIRLCNLYRTDGKTCSSIFSMHPVLSNSESHSNFDVFWSLRTHTIQKNAKALLREPRCTRSEEPSEVVNTGPGVGSLPHQSDRIRQLSHSQPMLIVPVDVSGQTFRQLCERRSRSYSVHEPCDAKVKRKKILRKCGALASTEFMNDAFGFGLLACDDLWKRCPSRERWERTKCMSQEINSKTRSKKLKPKVVKERNNFKKQDDSSYCIGRKSLCSLFKSSSEELNDLWIEGQLETDDRMKAEEILLSTRSQSLPRSFRSLAKKSERRVNSIESLTCSRTLETSATVSDLGSSRSRIKSHRPGKRCEQISWPVGTLRDAASGDQNFTEQFLKENLLSRSTATSIPHVLEAGEGSREVIVHIPEQPWTRPFATVKLRPQSSKVEANSYQTSSGNWSTDSACHSMHSDTVTVLPPGDRLARQSLDKDSAISEINHFDRFFEDTDQLRSSQAETEQPNNYANRSSLELSFVDSSSDIQLKSECGKANTAPEFWPLDDRSSLYSVDQDGFYTSMHADSGLPKNNGLSKSNATLTPCDELDDSNEIVASCQQQGSENDDSSATIVFNDWIPSEPTVKNRHPLLQEKSDHSSLNSNSEKLILGSDVHYCSFAENGKASIDSCNMASFNQSTCFKGENKKEVSCYPSFCTITLCSSDTDDASVHNVIETNTEAQSSSKQQNQLTAVNCGTETMLAGEEQTHENHGNGQFESLEIGCEGFDMWPAIHLSESNDSVGSSLKSKKKSRAPVKVETISSDSAFCLGGDKYLTKSPLNVTINSVEPYRGSKSACRVLWFSGNNATNYRKVCQNKFNSRISSKPAIVETDFLSSKVRTAKPKKFKFAANSSNGFAYDTTAGFGYLGSDAIATCTGIVPKAKAIGVDLMPASAKLVITSPVTKCTKYVENPHKRMQCTSVVTGDLSHPDTYGNPRSGYNTLSGKSSLPKKFSQKSAYNSDSLNLLDFCGTMKPSGLSEELKKNKAQFTNSLTRNSLMSAESNIVKSEQRMELSSASALDEPKEFVDGNISSVPVRNKQNRKSEVFSSPRFQQPSHHSMSLPRAVAQHLSRPTLLSEQYTTVSPFSMTLERNRGKANSRDISEKKFNITRKKVHAAVIGSDTASDLVGRAVTLLPDFLSSSLIHSNASGYNNNWQAQSICKETSSVELLPCPTAPCAKDQRSSREILDKDGAFLFPSHMTTDSSINSQNAFALEATTSKCLKNRSVNCDAVANVSHSVTTDSSPDLVPHKLRVSRLNLTKSQDSISSILSALECSQVPKTSLLSCESSNSIKTVIPSQEKFANQNAGCDSGQVMGSIFQNAQTGSNVESCKKTTIDRNSTIESFDAAGSKMTTGTLSTLPQKQSFESDSSGLGNSVYGSPTVSPSANNDAIESIDSSLTMKAVQPENNMLEALCFPGPSNLTSPDVIPLMARNQLRYGSKEASIKQDSNVIKGSKQTAV